MVVAEDRKEKLIALPRTLWEALERDAARCRRSVTRQVEAVLVAYFELGSVELNGITGISEAVTPPPSTRTREAAVESEPLATEKDTQRLKRRGK